MKQLISMHKNSWLSSTVSATLLTASLALGDRKSVV